MSVAKAITSAYIPLAGFIMSKRIHEAIQHAPTDAKFWHGYTNAGHPAACAVGLRNLQIIEEEHLVDNAAAMGRRLVDGLRSIEHPAIGEVRGLGLIAAIELVADRSTRERFDPPGAAGAKVVAEMRNRGVITRARLDSILLAPPLVITSDQVDRIIETVEGSIQATIGV
jgi:4-aminobutyrate--pyruvate transaminase